ncbi:MAG: hypothetical protein Q9162_003912 [Coniocarpon cinnabarinum]
MADYPESVGIRLRRARYFADVQPDPPQALKNYVAALSEAHEEKMHPLSDAVVGIWVDMARVLEKYGNIQQAIEVLETQRQRCLDWIEHNGEKEDCAGERGRLLTWAIQLASKIGELFTNPMHPNRQKSEEFLVWSVETTLKENERKRKEGLRPGEDAEIIDQDQQGAQLESLGNNFEEQNNFAYASQLFLQALMLKTKTDCHNVVLMNNIAAAIAQQRPTLEPGTPPPSPAQLRDSGRVWATRALELAEKIKPPTRDAECDRGCVVATHNLGEFAEMDGNVTEARERYEEAGSIAHAIGFEEGVISANEGLKRLSRPPVTKSKKSGFWSR